MAEGILKKLLADVPGERPVRVISAGTGASDGARASPEAIEAMDERGIDLREHRARRFTSLLGAEADLVLTMTAGNRENVLQLLPELEDRAFTLKDAARRFGTATAGDGGGPGDDIADPFGHPLDVYRQTAAEIEKNLRALLPWLQEWPPRERTSIDKGESRNGTGGTGK